MKTLKITTFWTTEEAGNVYRLLDELQSAVWESYGEDIDKMYRKNHEEQLEIEMEWEQERKKSPPDEIPF